jgi:predicted HTH domain antitoxin
MKFVNTIIEHITNGNQNEGRMVEVMGGVILETESERLRREGKEQILFSLVQDGIITMEEAAKRASQNEGKMVRVMGGVILETESERLRREGREEGIERGKEQILFGLVKDGLITLEEAAKRANMTENSFEESMKRFEA